MRKDSYFLLNCKQFVDIFFVLWTFADFFSGYASVWGPWYSQKQLMAEFILRMKSAIVREALLLLWRAVMVEVTGLEPATAWSQTRNATNCATPRNEGVPKCAIAHCQATLIVFRLQSYKKTLNPANFLLFI